MKMIDYVKVMKVLLEEGESIMDILYFLKIE
jgi:hypothetical protein